jgi:hypothetical protein
MLVVKEKRETRAVELVSGRMKMGSDHMTHRGCERFGERGGEAFVMGKGIRSGGLLISLRPNGAMIGVVCLTLQ